MSILITSVLNCASDRLAISLLLSCIFCGALICSFTWAIIFLSPRTCYIVRGRALGVHQGGATQVAALWCCVWGRGPRGNRAACSALCWFSITSPATHNQIGPFWCWCPVGGLVHALGPCGSLQGTLLWGWEFLLLPPQPPQVFSVNGLRLYFPILEPWVVWSVSLTIWSSWFICMRMWNYPLQDLRPHWVLSTWLPFSAPPTGLDECFFFNSLVVGLPYSLVFCQFCFFFFFNCCCPSFGCARRKQCVYLRLHLGWKP